MPKNVLVEGLIEYTATQIENLASDFLHRRVDITRKIPTDVEMLLEGLPDVQLNVIAGLLGNNVEGCVCNHYMSRLITVFIDRRIADGISDARYHAVIAEEIAHIVLHRVLILQINSVEDFIETRQCDQWKQIEKDAELFSLAIRIPSDTVLDECSKTYREVVSDYGFLDTEVTLRQVKNTLADKYAVSYEDMNRRLSRWPLRELCDCISFSAIARSEKLLHPETLEQLSTLVTQQSLFSY